MTRADMISRVLDWDKAAAKRNEPETRKSLWRVIDALEGRPVSGRAVSFLAVIEQTETVREIRKEIGMDNDAPLWAGRIA